MANTRKTISDTLRSESSTVKINTIDETQLQADSEDHYWKIVTQIYGLSEERLNKQADEKKLLRKVFYWTFAPLLIIQFVAIIVLIILNGRNVVSVDSTVLTVLVSAMFVETLGAIIVMIRYCFDSSQEVKILEVLNGIVSNFQKFKKGAPNKDKKEKD